MPTLHLGDRSRHFKQLQRLQSHRLARRSDPLSAYQYEGHLTALTRLNEILTQEWSILLLRRRFFQSRQSYVEFIPRCDVVTKLLTVLEAYEKCLTHQALYNPRGAVKYDLTEFEQRLFGAVEALNLLGSSSSDSGSDLPKTAPLRYGIVRGPKRTGWMCTREGETWRANMAVLLDPGKGKLRVREWEHEDVGFLVDGLISVTFSDGEGEDARAIPLAEALPREVVDHFVEAEDKQMCKGVVFHMDFLVAENGREIEMKSCRENGIVEIEGEGAGDAIVGSEQRSPIHLRFRSRVAKTVLKGGDERLDTATKGPFMLLE